MKLSKLIEKLEKIENKYGNIEVRIDNDENGWYDVEKVQFKKIDPFNNTGSKNQFADIKISNKNKAITRVNNGTKI